jgi:hypothetical protein
MKNKNSKKENIPGTTSAQKRSIFLLTILACCIMFMLIFINACEKFTEPGVIYNASLNTSTNTPVITRVSPPGVAYAGVSSREIKIYGRNLGVKNGTDTVWVYIGGARAVIKEIIMDSVITIYRPKLSDDHYDNANIVLSVTDPKAIDTSSSITYMVELPGLVVGDYTNVTASMAGVDFDKEENLYTVAGRSVWRNDFSGVTLTQLMGTGNLAGDFRTTTDAKLGPGEFKITMYAAVNKNYLYSFRADTTATTVSSIKAVKIAASLPAAALITKFDFDENGNIYAGGSGGIYYIYLNKDSVSQNLGYDNANLTEMRVFNNSLYISDSISVWQIPITGEGVLGGQSELVNLSADPNLSNCRISSFTFDEFGNLYLCLQHNPRYCLFFRESDGSITPFYHDSSILPNTVEKLIWGNSRYLYLCSSSLAGATAGTFASARIYRMNMDRNGAPYQGRKFLN